MVLVCQCWHPCWILIKFWIKLYDKILESTEHEFGEILSNDSSSSTSLRYTKQLNLISYIGANIKGGFSQMMGNLPFELATLATAFEVQSYSIFMTDLTFWGLLYHFQCWPFHHPFPQKGFTHNNVTKQFFDNKTKTTSHETWERKHKRPSKKM